MALTAALLGSIAGVALMAGGRMLAAVSGGSSDLPTAVVSGAGAGAAVACLAYIARMMATGRLVARDPNEQLVQLRLLIDTVRVIAERSMDREVEYHELMTAMAADSLDRRRRGA